LSCFVEGPRSHCLVVVEDLGSCVRKIL
jgi:hypothetical protein